MCEVIGSVIHITSVGVVHQTAGVSYCTSKAGFLVATKNTLLNYIHKSIRVNTIAPGRIVTDKAYPNLDPESCIDCHVCEEVCPTHAVHLVAA